MHFSLAATLALAASASAHMFLDFPIPYMMESGDPVDNFPLNNTDPISADFPCKQHFAVNVMNEWNAGETKRISFLGSAVHSGGSCQISLTPSLQPSKDSQWKVIHSIIGGFPANRKGNFDANPYGTQAGTFPVTIPTNVPAGDYTFSVSWLNREGDREFYQFCAPIKVGGGTGGDGQASTKDVASALGHLPDMFVANLPRTQCRTNDDVDFEYPDPGQSVVKGLKSVPNYNSNVTGTGCDIVTKKGAGAGNLGTPTTPTNPSSAPILPSSVESQPAASSAVPSNPGGVFAPSASSPAPSATATSTVAPKPAPSSAPAPASSAPAPASSAAPAPVPAPPAASKSVPCPTDGVIVCIGTKQFGLCDRGFAFPMALSEGTSCTNGAISRRSIRFPRSFLHRAHGAHGKHHI